MGNFLVNVIFHDGNMGKTFIPFWNFRNFLVFGVLINGTLLYTKTSEILTNWKRVRTLWQVIDWYQEDQVIG